MIQKFKLNGRLIEAMRTEIEPISPDSLEIFEDCWTKFLPSMSFLNMFLSYLLISGFTPAAHTGGVTLRRTYRYSPPQQRYISCLCTNQTALAFSFEWSILVWARERQRIKQTNRLLSTDNYMKHALCTSLWIRFQRFSVPEVGFLTRVLEIHLY